MPPIAFIGWTGIGGFKIEAHKDLEDSKSDEDPKGIHVVECDITHHKRNQGAEVAKGTRKLHSVIVVTHRRHDSVAFLFASITTIAAPHA